MVLWVDECRPKGLDNLDLHPDVSRRLKKLAATGDIPHILFYGPAGAGKKTRISALLREIFGPGAEKTKVVLRQVKTKSKTIEVATVASSYHIEINASDAGNADTHVIQEIIKDLAMTQAVGAVAKMGALAAPGADAGAGAAMSDHAGGDTAAPATPPPFKVVVLHEVDRLSDDAQNGLRRTMEQFTQSCRLILCAESACRVAAPLKSRCLLTRVPAPTTAETLAALAAVARRQQLDLPGELAERIADSSQGNLRKAILMLEATAVDGYPFSAGAAPRRPDWEVFAEHVATLVLQEQSAQRLLVVRGKLYELLTNCIPADAVIKALNDALVSGCGGDDELKGEISRWAAYYEHRMQTGSKPLFHIEAFLAKVMAVVKKWSLSAR